MARERLFAWLDGQLGQASAAWLSGAPGAGKTTLAASWLRSRSLRCLWYRFDADDNDAGRFFVMLGQAVDELASRVSLPVFAAEHLAQPQAFARAWFRAAFAALPRPLVVVFDNLEQAALPILAELLARAIDEAPDGITLLVTCRHAAPQELASALLSGQLVALPAALLAFTPAETRQYAHELKLDEGEVQRAAHRAGGWAAGLRLLAGADATSARETGSPQLLFDYFAGLLHDRLSAFEQHLLLVGALLPWVSAEMLAELAEVNDAQARLERLCAQNLFIEPVARTPGVYRLHPMWREFLLQRGIRTWSAARRATLQRAAAIGFARHGDIDAAIDLALDAGDAGAALAWLLDALEDKLALGQLDQWAAWVRRLPDAVRDHDPHLRYGLARIAFLRDDSSAATHYEQACAGFAAISDLRGQQLCAAGILEWSYNSDNFIGHQRWSDLLRRGRMNDADDAAPGPEQHALRLLNGGLLACFFDGDFESEGVAWVDALLSRLGPGGAENDKLSAAITLLGCLERHKRWDDAQRLAAGIETLLESPRIGPRLKILARQQIAVDLHRQTGAYGEARRLALAARAQAHESGFGVLEFEALAVLLFPPASE